MMAPTTTPNPRTHITGDDSILAYVLAHSMPRDHAIRAPLPGLPPRVGDELLAVGMDNGNDALKLAVISATGDLITRRIPMAYQQARVIQSGSGEITYAMGASAYWIGATALRHDGRDLPVGPTDQRVVDARWVRVAAAALADLLTEAGYAPGSYNLSLGIAVPNLEIVRNASNRLGVCEPTARALKQHVRGQTWTVTRTGTGGDAATWTFAITEVLPQAQSLGTYTLWSKGLDGRTVQAVDGVVVIDIGGGDLQVTEITLKPYQMITQRLGDGTLAIARALIEQFPRLQLNNVAAQQGLMTGTLMIAGRYQDVAPQVQEALSSEGQNIISTILPVLQQSRRFVILTGGGVLLLHDLLVPRLRATGKQATQDYIMVDQELASLVNAIGVLFAVLLKRGA